VKQISNILSFLALILRFLALIIVGLLMVIMAAIESLANGIVGFLRDTMDALVPD